MTRANLQSDWPSASDATFDAALEPGFASSLDGSDAPLNQLRGFKTDRPLGPMPPNVPTHSDDQDIAPPEPLPKRPKGRLAVGIILITICYLVGQHLWGMFLYHTAYGTIEGRLAQVAAPWDGVVAESFAVESDELRQASPVGRIDSLSLRHEIDRLSDDLAIAQAELDAEISRLRWESQDKTELAHRAHADHYEAEGKLAASVALMKRLARDRSRAEALFAKNAMPAEERDLVVFTEMGQREKVAELITSTDRLGQRAESVEKLQDSGFDQLTPRFTAIRKLENEIQRLREVLEQGRLASPFDAVVTKRHKLVGERVDAQEPVVEILQAGSLEVVLYLSQEDVEKVAIGETLHVWMDPYPESIPCTVARLGEKLVTAPPTIERHYWRNENLMPVFLTPDPAYRQWMALRLGCVVRW